MKNLHEYKAKLENRLEEYMEMPVNAHNIEVIEDTMMCLKCLDEYKMTGEGHEKREMSKRLDKLRFPNARGAYKYKGNRSLFCQFERTVSAHCLCNTAHRLVLPHYSLVKSFFEV